MCASVKQDGTCRESQGMKHYLVTRWNHERGFMGWPMHGSAQGSGAGPRAALTQLNLQTGR